MDSEERQGATVRPRDRRARIISLAAEMFWKHGFDGVSIVDLSSAAGITSGALYRHFPGKDALLAEPIRELIVAWYGGALIAVDRFDDPVEALRRTIEATVYAALDQPSTVGLWYRERRHIPPDDFEEIREMRHRTYVTWRKAVAAYAPDLSETAIDFRLATAHGLLYALPLVDIRAGRDNLGRRLCTMMQAQFDTPAAGLTGAIDPAADTRPEPRNRTEHLLSVGAELFREHGYHRVSIDQIGEAVGLQGPSIYNHFESKSELLWQLMTRIGEQLNGAVQTVDVAAADPHAELAQVLDRYIELSLRESNLVAVYASELQCLNPEQYTTIQRRRLARAKVLGDLVVRVRPDLSRAEAKVTLLAALELLFALARDPDLSRLVGARDELRALLHAAIYA